MLLLPYTYSITSLCHVQESSFITRSGGDFVTHGLISFPPWSSGGNDVLIYRRQLRKLSMGLNFCNEIVNDEFIPGLQRILLLIGTVHILLRHRCVATQTDVRWHFFLTPNLGPSGPKRRRPEPQQQIPLGASCSLLNLSVFGISIYILCRRKNLHYRQNIS